ncbi:hypothetical protein P43SY_011745 [Pythium insidiosum]|uniref:Uncharacterized protein n=1 Tax=Pythium insidiosum TaxID=114742 RepID=A0AAD5Q192_PYTIN|nr:hypothetical protein P43SY_011745 [Pythium insidiosum]
MLRIAASDVDALVRFPVLTAAFDALGVSVVRNPMLDGVTLDASELLLCSCQRLSAASSASASSSASSLTQLVLHRLEAFALRVRREFPAWQVLPHDRVAAALLVLLDLETKHNASRLLPSYLRPDGSAFSGARAGRRASLAWADAEEEEEEVETAVGQEELERPSSAMVTPVAAAVLVAEPKRHSAAASPQRSSKKSKAPSLERHATVASLSPMVRETKDVVVAEPRRVPPHQDHRGPAVVDVPDAATTMAVVAVTAATQTSARSPALETPTSPLLSPRLLLPPLPVEEITETPTTSTRRSEPQHSAASDAPGEDDGFEMFDASGILAEIAGALRSLPQFDTTELSPSVESPDVASSSSENKDNDAPFTLLTPLEETSSDSPLVGEERPGLEQLGAAAGQPPEEEEENEEEKEALRVSRGAAALGLGLFLA